jgi:hypothetical protein
MTSISRICFEPMDIRAIQLECKDCGATVSFNLDKWEPQELMCPNCKETLIRGPEQSIELRSLGNLADALKTLKRKTPDERCKFRLRFEFEPAT